MSALSTTLTRGARAATASTARLTTAIVSSHSPSMVVNIASVWFGSPLSRTTRTASASTESGTVPLLTVTGLNLSYGSLRALSDINLTVRSGELVALAGENGAGKTTLVRCIAGDVIPASGEIYLGGKRVPPDPT